LLFYNAFSQSPAAPLSAKSLLYFFVAARPVSGTSTPFRECWVVDGTSFYFLGARVALISSCMVRITQVKIKIL
jgi:hypothetical protein